MSSIGKKKKNQRGELNRKQMRNEGTAEHMKDNGNERRARWNEPGENQKVQRLLLLCVHSEQQIEDLCDGARLKGWLNCPKMVILLYLQVNGKYLLVISQHGFSVLMPAQRSACEIMGKACHWCFALEVWGPNWKNSSMEFNSIPAGLQHNRERRNPWPDAIAIFVLLFFFFFNLIDSDSHLERCNHLGLAHWVRS